jgi:hypothetical protein
MYGNPAGWQEINGKLARHGPIKVFVGAHVMLILILC